jgi:hypothetical protein
MQDLTANRSAASRSPATANEKTRILHSERRRDQISASHPVVANGQFHRTLALRQCRTGCRTVEFCAASFPHLVRLPVAAKVPHTRHCIGSGLPVDQLPPFRLSRSSRLFLADRTTAVRLCGHLGHCPLPAKTLELLPRRRSIAAVCRLDGDADDLVPSSCAILLGTSLVL